ncbi:hypothetical protein N7474_010504 [Penicillium riverlandense]|uniref:uncharacterized protein n=1 Tax=Penicillium riverlandense TaxID=1903569 RepID=UPI002547714B|nr:uncharacterized protein N7474_010504 [Penicillium riverlandense]KAJ5806912.1 hypothetical protein N7474_010504 [Penicillium riverlandense]
MRYENWDVLLFPETCKTPMQEFKTQCFVTKDRGWLAPAALILAFFQSFRLTPRAYIESPYLHTPSIVTPSSYYAAQGNFGQLPILTTFIPSLPPDAPFRVSIHSWEKPRPSRFIESLMQPDDLLLFEARVFVDGLCTAGSIFGQRTAWPHVIDLSSRIDRNGNQDFLRFPPFHPDILEQRGWNAEDMQGRIRVVISEGFARPHRDPPFERVKDAIALSFQHAPIDVLEYSNIAWPNSSMWTPAPRNAFKYSSASGYSEFEPEDAHTHSPSKQGQIMATTNSHSSGQIGGQMRVYNAWAPGRDFPMSMTQWPYQRDPRWGGYHEPPHPGPAIAIDPYISEVTWRQRGARSSREDVPMPDYTGSNSSGSRAISSMTGISYEHSKQPSIIALMDDDQYHQLIQTLSPNRTLPDGHVTSTSSSAIVPMGTKLSAAADARTASYARTSTATRSALREVSQPSTREVSGSSMKSNAPADPTLETTTPSKPHVSPSGNVKSRKEGPDNKENGDDNQTPRRTSGKKCTPPSTSKRRTSGSVEKSSEKARKSAATAAAAAAALVDATPTKPRVTSDNSIKSMSGAFDDLETVSEKSSVLTEID